MSVIFVSGSTNTITLDGLVDNITDAFINTASVAYTIKLNGSTVDSGTLDYVASSNGIYRANTDASLISSNKYTLTVTATAGSTVREFIETINVKQG